MELEIKESTLKKKYVDDDEDALLNEAICCSRNLEIKTDDDEDDNENSKNENGVKMMIDPPANSKPTNILWCDMESSDSSQNISDLSSGRKSDLSVFAIDIKTESTEVLQKNGDSKDSESEEVEAQNCGPKSDLQNSSPARKRMREGENNDNDESKLTRSRKNSTSSSSTLSNNSNKKNTEFETDPAVLARRQKDIDYGKNTIGYDRYIQAIPKEERTKEHPRTPPMYVKYSRRGWDGMVKLWRKQLHAWDPKEDGAVADNES